MNRNDYRRAFIMLRAARPGYGGHARLERRTTTGSLYFIVTAPEDSGTLQAALVGRSNGRYYAAPLGALARDRRGQLALACAFDPRSIDGRPLEAYFWAAIADTGSGCAVALTGNVDGSRDVDPAALEAAVCALFAAPNVPAADLPDDPPVPVAPIAAGSYADASAEATPTAPAPDAPTAPTALPESDVKIYTRARQSAPRPARPDAAPAHAEPAPDAPAAAPKPAAEPAAEPANDASAGPETPAPETAAPPQTAAQALGLDITRPWPAPAEPLRRLFATQAAVEAPLGDGYVYIQSVLPTGGARDTCYVGLRAADGRVAGIRYAVPGRPAPEPPAGLDDYAWHDAGYWVLDIGIS